MLHEMTSLLARKDDLSLGNEPLKSNSGSGGSVVAEASAAPNGTAAHPYGSLLDATRLIVSARSSQEALEAVFALLHQRHGVRALELEYLFGTRTRSAPFGDLEALQRAYQEEQSERICICYLDDPYAPPGQILYLLTPEAAAPRDFLEAITQQIAMRLGQENLIRRAVDAEEKAGQRISEVAAIYEIGQAIDRIELPDLLDLITRRAAHLMEAQTCSLMLADEANQTLSVAAGFGLPEDAMGQEQRVGEGLAGRVAQNGQPLRIPGDAADPRLEGIELRSDISTSMLVPMRRHDGKMLGVLSIRRDHEAPAFSEDDEKLFSFFAKQAALAITNVRLYEDLKRRANELYKLTSLTRSLIINLNLDDLLDRIASDICGVVGFDRVCLYMRETHRPLFLPRVWRGYSETSIGRNPMREGEGAIGLAARSKTLLLFDARQETGPEERQMREYLLKKGFARALGTDSFIAMPILTSQNKCLGVVVADNRARRLPILPEQVNLLEAFVSQAGIVIEHLRLYEETQENYRHIHRLKNYTDNLLQSIGAGIISTDAQGVVARWTRAAEETLHLPSETFRRATLTDLILMLGLPIAEQDRLMQEIERVVETGERCHLHKWTLHPRGRPPMTWNLSISRLMDHNQERAGVVMIFEDVTQEVRLEGEVEKMRRLADIGQLAAKMAHEVRNSLSPIKSAAQLIRDELVAQRASTEWPDVIIEEVDDLNGLTTEMLDFARPMPLHPRSLSLSELLQKQVEALEASLREPHPHPPIVIQYAPPPDLPEIQADPVQLRRALRNLLMNAVQAMPDGGTLSLSAEFHSRAGQVALHFRDTGVGIAPQDLERIFRPFVTTKPKGTGLGLPIVQKIIHQHGGRVEVESQVGVGTCFTVFLPLVPPPPRSDFEEEDMPLISPRPIGHYPDN
jgi:signal transduction histidine kinase